ncbi:MAG: FliM/FliN family flagellar motor switch protein, partial [Bdellovibrionales bacterium]|nr:FliM/FliN family flagellar motor switch protein [Bdellovibrionales bacterium]
MTTKQPTNVADSTLEFDTFGIADVFASFDGEVAVDDTNGSNGAYRREAFAAEDFHEIPQADRLSAEGSTEPVPPGPVGGQAPASRTTAGEQLAFLSAIRLSVGVQLGEVTLTGAELLELTPGTPIRVELDADEPVVLHIGGEPIATARFVEEAGEIFLEVVEVSHRQAPPPPEDGAVAGQV